MRNVPDPPAPTELAGDGREILFPHDPTAGPATAVRNVLIQSSLLVLKESGHYARYTKFVDAAALEPLLASFTPGWIPMSLAIAHYEACEALALTPEEFAAVGSRVGKRVQETLLVSLAKKVRDPNFDPWDATGALQRMWPRLFRGGSLQIVKAGPKEKVLEERGFVLNRYHYYRQCHLAVTRATHTALGSRVAYTKIVSYDAAADELVVRIGWL